MAASKPTYQYQKFFNYPLTLKCKLGTLAYDLGCFPFDNRAFASHVCLLLLKFMFIFRVLLDLKKFIQHSPRLISALP
jgi:hypothetical protein